MLTVCLSVCLSECVSRAQSLSPTDHLASFYLALQLAVSRQVTPFNHQGMYRMYRKNGIQLCVHPRFALKKQSG